VLTAHVWKVSSPGGTPFQFGWFSTYFFPPLVNGVTLFFVLSGFLLFLPFATAALREQPRPAFAAYLRNRALRILPAYWFVLLFVALVLQSAALYSAGKQGAIHDPSLLGQNALLLQTYHPSTVGTGIGPAWSLVIEVAFYLVLPLLVLAAIWLAGRAATHAQRVLALLFPAALLALIGVIGT
jgi:peptidoglycan/LPS O-acetylase OafA/YrhL